MTRPRLPASIRHAAAHARALERARDLHRVAVLDLLAECREAWPGVPWEPTGNPDAVEVSADAGPRRSVAVRALPGRYEATAGAGHPVHEGRDLRARCRRRRRGLRVWRCQVGSEWAVVVVMDWGDFETSLWGVGSNQYEALRRAAADYCGDDPGDDVFHAVAYLNPTWVECEYGERVDASDAQVEMEVRMVLDGDDWTCVEVSDG